MLQSLLLAALSLSIPGNANPVHARDTTTATWGYGGSPSSSEVGGVSGGSSTWGRCEASTITKNVSAGETCAISPASTITISSCSPVGGGGTCSPSIITAPVSTLTLPASTITHCSEDRGTCSTSTISITGPTTVITSCSQETCKATTTTLTLPPVTSVLTSSCTNVGGVQTCSSSTVVSTETVSGSCSSASCHPSVSTLTLPPVTITTGSTCPSCTPAAPQQTITSYITKLSTVNGGISIQYSTIYSTVAGPGTTEIQTVTKSCTASCSPVGPTETLITTVYDTKTVSGTATVVVTSIETGASMTIVKTVTDSNTAPCVSATATLTSVSISTAQESATTIVKTGPCTSEGGGFTHTESYTFTETCTETSTKFGGTTTVWATTTSVASWGKWARRI